MIAVRIPLHIECKHADFDVTSCCLAQADVLPMGHSADQESYLTFKLHRFFTKHFDLKQ